MNPHAAWRFALARDLAERLRGRAGVEAIAVGGSVARDYSDRYSDIELILLWSQPPDLDVRTAIMRDLDAEFRFPELDSGHDSALRIRGIPVDIWHLTIASQETAIDTVVRQHSIDLVASSFVDTMRTCLALDGAALVERLQREIEPYPEPLTIRFLETYLPHFYMRHIELAARRDNPTTFLHTLTDIQCSLFLILLAINGQYFPTFKWLYQTLERLPIAPRQMSQRYRQMIAAPPIDAVKQLRAVLTETLAIVDARYPQVDTAFAHYCLDHPPRAYDPPGSA